MLGPSCVQHHLRGFSRRQGGLPGALLLTEPAFLGVLGWPLSYTLSPAVHRAALERLGLDWVYLRWPVPPERLGAAIAGLSILGAAGANVTIPHKRRVIELVDEVEGEAAATGAVNTIERREERLVGHNTDVHGFMRLLDDTGATVTGATALVLGAGGAARAVVAALGRAKASGVVVAARNDGAARALVSSAAATCEAVPWHKAAAAAGSADLVINATPLGSSGEQALPEARLRPGQVVVDLVYRPAQTPLLERARAHGAVGVGGLGMLVHQAAASLRIWTGLEPPLDDMKRAATAAAGSEL